MPAVRSAACLVLILAGCSKPAGPPTSTPPVAVPPPPAPAPTVAKQAVPIPKPTAPVPPPAPPTFAEAVAEEEVKAVENARRDQKAIPPATLRQDFDLLPVETRTHIRVIDEYLPTKRIKDVTQFRYAGDSDCTIVSAHKFHFADAGLAVRRILEYADDTGVNEFLADIGLTKSNDVRAAAAAAVRAKLEFGPAVLADKEMARMSAREVRQHGGYARLDEFFKDFVRKHPTLFPPVP